jgi:hypothetical protein
MRGNKKTRSAKRRWPPQPSRMFVSSFGCAKISGEPEAIDAGNFPGGADWPIRVL